MDQSCIKYIVRQMFTTILVSDKSIIFMDWFPIENVVELTWIVNSLQLQPCLDCKLQLRPLNVELITYTKSS